jgi:hypothetical protein
LNRAKAILVIGGIFKVISNHIKPIRYLITPLDLQAVEPDETDEERRGKILMLIQI